MCTPINNRCIIVVHRYINIYHTILKMSILFTEIPNHSKQRIYAIYNQTG